MEKDDWSLSQKLIECGKVVRLSFPIGKGDWSDLIKFAEDREKQNRGEVGKSKAKKRGLRA